ncbi:recombinase family protein [Jannaschia donghaensis]|uniref:Putative transposon Tn552 DNA-invertase bin3 n=1 Tax=Jannaschia donghaensis TaxID=420998 RepID=A0A0M6YLX9_9RHOB|nr:recombinase family protein [Jannaschia donghaensis]CTQ50523.1 Putative transposon Tn552 DNA-invertase bin3 [Jannaschia donghaensis]
MQPSRPPGRSDGYARVSTTDQDLDVRYEALEKAGCRVIRAENVSGTSVRGRDGLRTRLDVIRPGDELVVTRVDCLARSMGDLQDIIRELKAKGATLPRNRTAHRYFYTGRRAIPNMLGVFAEFETNLRRERQMEGIAKAKVRGVYKGRKASIDVGQVRRLLVEGVRPSAVARQLGISRTSVWRVSRCVALDSTGTHTLSK